MKPLIVRRFSLQLDAGGQLRRRCLIGPLCNEQGCERFGLELRLPDDERMWYCVEHAYDAGFCVGCGNFWAGCESFDFSRTGLCENCEGQGDYDDYDDYWEDDWMDWDDLPHMQVL